MSPKDARERELVIETLKWVVEGMQQIIGGNVEVVLHDLSKPGHSVVAIANGHITGRSIGSPIISGPFDDLGLQKLMSGEFAEAGKSYSIVSDYRTRSRLGHELDSTSIILRDEKGEAYAAFCVNADHSRLRELDGVVKGLLASIGGAPQEPVEPESASVDDLVQEIIQSGIAATEKPVAAMGREDKMEAVRHMNDRGLFLIRSSVDLAAAHLGVTRFTVYNYLDQLRGKAPARQEKQKSHRPDGS
ncbi:PAS domain-containing protein [Aquamicrobium sp. LC103]|uniref:helix-turn-helix transcriptional regulator n=1 Tax=Aquamicrobium sp. LC103 TaxID=1120658 RepID=UPI0014859E5E|nr:PAS domain-containing protein [Aquamicrobium sp. LC103]